MADQRLTIETNDDKATKQLARLLLVAEIASQLAAVYMMVEMIEHGSISYQLQWHWKNFKERFRAQRDDQRLLRRQIGETIFEAQQILKEHHG